MIYDAITKITVSAGLTTLGALIAIIVEPLSTGTKFGLLMSGAVLGALFAIFIAITRTGMRRITVKIFEALAMIIVALVAGGLLVELLAFRYSIYEHRAAGTLSPDAVIYLIVGVSFTIAAIGYDGVKKVSEILIDVLRQRLGQKPEKKDETD